MSRGILGGSFWDVCLRAARLIIIVSSSLSWLHCKLIPSRNRIYIYIALSDAGCEAVWSGVTVGEFGCIVYVFFLELTRGIRMRVGAALGVNWDNICLEVAFVNFSFPDVIFRFEPSRYQSNLECKLPFYDYNDAFLEKHTHIISCIYKTHLRAGYISPEAFCLDPYILLGSRARK